MWEIGWEKKENSDKSQGNMTDCVILSFLPRVDKIIRWTHNYGHQ